MANQAPAENPPPYKQADNELLEPKFKFGYDNILSNLHKSDQAFAREVVKMIATRAEVGIFSHHSWGYNFIEPPVFETSLVLADLYRRVKGNFLI